MSPHSCEPGHAGEGIPASCRGALTANPTAAALYRAAAVAARRHGDPVPLLAMAVAADPDWPVAATDLAVLTMRPLPVAVTSARPCSRWERHHLEIVRTVAAGHRSRAEGLLREHVADGSCDALACRVVGCPA